MQKTPLNSLSEMFCAQRQFQPREFFIHPFPPLEQDVFKNTFDNPGDVSES